MSFALRLLSFFTGCFLLSGIPVFAQQTILNGPAGSVRFGESVTLLPNGNYVVTDTGWTAGTLESVGAVYLYSGTSDQVISTLKGSSSGDLVGSGGIKVLSNGNYVVSSPFWANGNMPGCGAVTYCSGSTGINGLVSSNNSLTGDRALSNAGNGGITLLPNGNFVVLSPNWTGGSPVSYFGAVTLVNGSTGLSGNITVTNSVVGSSSSTLAEGGITVLSNSNYLIQSPHWSPPAGTPGYYFGAVTWCNGTTGTTGLVSSSNSLVGSSNNDKIGQKVVALSNGNYVVASPDWKEPGTSEYGAATWGNGTTGISGTLSTSNSLVGGHAGKEVIALANGNYVVTAPGFSIDTLTETGAVVWGNGTTGISGYVSVANALTGSAPYDRVGSISLSPPNAGPPDGKGLFALSSGNYVVCSPNWANGSRKSTGAVTFCNGLTGRTGKVDTTNSLWGLQQYSYLGVNGILPLTNGNYVALNYGYYNPVSGYYGSVTWGNGTTGVTGSADSSNSMEDLGRVYRFQINPTTGITATALANGNYVICNPDHHNGLAHQIGLVTWGNGSVGTKGHVDSTNTLFGFKNYDQIGSGGITALANGNFVIHSPYAEQTSWSGKDVGAVTWCRGDTAVVGNVNGSNSLMGYTDNERLGSFLIEELADGNYIVPDPYRGRFHPWETDYTGASIWASGAPGRAGYIGEGEEIIGGKAGDFLGDGGTFALPDGNYMVKSNRWHKGAQANVGVITYGLKEGESRGLLTACNSVISNSPNNGAGMSWAYNEANQKLYVGVASDKRLTILDNPLRKIVLLPTQATAQGYTYGGKWMPLFTDNCLLVASIKPNPSYYIADTASVRVTNETATPFYQLQPYVRRYYSLSNVRGATSAIARLRLYFTQEDFDDYNTNRGTLPPLPVDGNDAAGKANVLFTTHRGKSATGAAGSFSSSSPSAQTLLINPEDKDVVWNAQLLRWEITFPIIEEGGFFLHTGNGVLKVSETGATNAGLSLAPVPTTGKLTVSATDPAIVGSKLQLLNLTGQPMQSVVATSSCFELDLTAYPAGIYLLRCPANGAVVRIVKQ